MNKEERARLKIISISFTIFGAGWFLIGVWFNGFDAMTVGLLAMILGELIDINKK